MPNAGPMCQLEAEVMKQADQIAQLHTATLANSTAHNGLVKHFQQLRAQVKRNSQSQDLLQSLAGVNYIIATKVAENQVTGMHQLWTVAVTSIQAEWVGQVFSISSFRTSLILHPGLLRPCTPSQWTRVI